MKNLFLLAGILFLILFACNSTSNSNAEPGRADTLATLQNNQVSISFSLWGGAITDFHLMENTINPFTWKMTREELEMANTSGAPFQGHFLCFGRWGSPTPGESEAGIPNNGEPAENWWELVSQDGTSLVMEFYAPIEKMSVSRKVKISQHEALVSVTEEFSNPNDFGRIFNVVQHPTVGRPFLSEASIVNSNASEGFMQSLALYGLERFQYEWPDGYADSMRTPVDLSRSDQGKGFVTTHILDEDYGWITISDPDHGLLLGYVWKSDEYPWLHVWHGLQDGRLWARGLEFGTTGIGDTFEPEKRFSMNFHGRRNFEFFDAHETKQKSYILFIITLPEKTSRIQSIEINRDNLSIVPEGGSPVNLSLDGLNPWE